MARKALSLLSSAVLAAILSGCGSTDKSPGSPTLSANVLSQPSVVKVLAIKPDDMWSQSFGHHQKGLIKQVAQGIEYLTTQPLTDSNYQALEQLSFYLRVYSSFGPDKDWESGSELAIDSALKAMTNMNGFYQITQQNARLHENYVVALFRLYYLEPMRQESTQPLIANHVDNLTRLINLYANTDLPQDIAFDYALWEVVRAAGILAFEARQKNKAEFSAAIQAGDKLQQALMAFLTSKNAERKGSDWPRQNALWGLSKFFMVYHRQYLNEYYELDEQAQKALDEDKTRLPQQDNMDAIDEQVWSALQSLNLADTKKAFSVPYVVNSFRGKSECEEDATLKGRCIAPTIEEALPIRRDCSDSLFILSQDLTKEQLDQSCQRLTTQTDTFHQKLDTKHVPVSNDFNDKLRVVVFDDQAQYNIYGQLVFDINTDNGGMYIEGTPQDPDNQATFFAYEHFWVRPKFDVWNLNHEYVHYLDGRFVKYDGFGHFPGNLVWWSEGLAEYISKGDDNSQSAELLHDIDKSEWLTLKQVFDTEYKDGGDRVYRWGYMATRFLNEEYPDLYRKMAHYLKTDFFDGYKKLLDEAGKNQQAAFAAWLDKFYQSHQAAQEAEDKTKPRQFYRYSYRTYLKPDYLVETPKHMHWQYWHANAK